MAESFQEGTTMDRVEKAHGTVVNNQSYHEQHKRESSGGFDCVDE